MKISLSPDERLKLVARESNSTISCYFCWEVLKHPQLISAVEEQCPELLGSVSLLPEDRVATILYPNACLFKFVSLSLVFSEARHGNFGEWAESVSLTDSHHLTSPAFKAKAFYPSCHVFTYSPFFDLSAFQGKAHSFFEHSWYLVDEYPGYMSLWNIAAMQSEPWGAFETVPKCHSKWIMTLYYLYLYPRLCVILKYCSCIIRIRQNIWNITETALGQLHLAYFTHQLFALSKSKPIPS